MTLDGSFARPTWRKSPSVATSIVLSSATAASTRAWSSPSTRGASVRSHRLTLSPQRRELLGRKRLSSRVREQAIDHARHVSNMKRRRCHTSRASIPLGIRQSLDEFVHAFANL
jgi:hypothetical protein